MASGEHQNFDVPKIQVRLDQAQSGNDGFESGFSVGGQELTVGKICGLQWARAEDEVDVAGSPSGAKIHVGAHVDGFEVDGRNCRDGAEQSLLLGRTDRSRPERLGEEERGKEETTQNEERRRHWSI